MFFILFSNFIKLCSLRTTYQSLHKVSNQARHYNYIANNEISHTWLDYYRQAKIRSNQIYVNEWNQMDEIVSHRSDSPHFYQPQIAIFIIEENFSSFSSLSSDDETFRTQIRTKLKEIMLQVNLDEVTSKYVNKNKTI